MIEADISQPIVRKARSIMSISKIRCTTCGFLVRVEMERSELLRREADEVSEDGALRCPKCRAHLRVAWKQSSGKAIQHEVY